MKKSLLALAMMSSTVFAGGNAPTLVIEGVFDMDLPGGTPKGVEIYVVQGGDLELCGVGSANNGGGSDGQEFTFPARVVTAGEHITVATETTNFMAYFGVAPDYTHGSMSINGDDAVELFCDGTVVDVYGDINTDGTGEPWDYVDSWAHRKMVDNPIDMRGAGGFVLENWTIPGAAAADGCTINASCTDAVYPKGTLPVELMNFSVE